nr:SDR family NAD(P)-dependent oxidoreductase [Acetomicrobium sp. S15 = DSM 107314]
MGCDREVATFKGKVAIITGAAGDIGREITKAFVKDGAIVNTCDVDKERLESLCRDLKGAPGEVVPHVVDITNLSAVNAMVDSVAKKFKSVHILVNGAAVCPLTSIEEIEESEWDKTLSINLKAPFFITKAVIPLMKASKWGRIINISSISGFIGGILTSPAYSISKAGLVCFTKYLAKRLAPYGITANAVAPGTAETRMTECFPKEGKEAILKGIPLGRLAIPADIVPAVMFLASDGAGFITGQTIHVNGGQYM